MIASAPGKLMLTGEYAVLEGAPALVVAVSRRAVAKTHLGPRGTSPFLVAVADAIAQRLGADHVAAKVAMEIVVDSRQFFEGPLKLGFGSSAAVTVAATALALASIDREEVLAIASAAHASAQLLRGARGSGADVAAAVHGGVIGFRRTDGARGETGGEIERLAWPAGVTVIPFFTGLAADTPRLIAAIQIARATHTAAVDAALIAIANASRAAVASCAVRAKDVATTGLIAALQLAALATDQLAVASGVPLVPGCVLAARAALAQLGGTAKTTGAGGGDVAVAVIPATEDATHAMRLLIEVGCKPLAVSVDNTGVDLQPDAQ